MSYNDGKHSFILDLLVKNPASWTPDEPSLYTLQLFRVTGDHETLLRETTCGLREVAISARDGLTLNGVPLKASRCRQPNSGPS